MLTASPATALEARITRNLPTLSPKLKQVATYCLQHARHLHLCRIQEVAQCCETQPVTVVRLAKRYGFRGFLDFKMAFLAGAEPGEAIPHAPESTDGFYRSAQLLAQAHTVWLHAAPATARVAQCYADMLRVAGLRVQWRPPHPWYPGACDVLLCVALGAEDRGDAVAIAQAIGIPAVMVTDVRDTGTPEAADAYVCVAHLGQGLNGIPAGLALAHAVCRFQKP